MLTIGSLFTGIGGIDLGLEWAGLGPVVWQCERDPYCREVLARHWPGVPIHEDVERLPSLPYVDLVCGGFPCQDVSSAGKGAGLEGARSGLWYAFAGVVSRVRPRFVVVENVASGAKRWLPQVRRSLHVLGYDSTAFALSAQDVGAPHRRKRIFVVAHPHGFDLRNEQQWVPARRPRRVRNEGEAEPLHDGRSWLAPNTDGQGELRERGSGDGRGGRARGTGSQRRSIASGWLARSIPNSWSGSWGSRLAGANRRARKRRCSPMRRSDRQRHRARVVLGRVTEVLATTAAVLATAARWRKEVKGREDYPEPGEPEPALHPLAHRGPLGED